VPLSELTYKSPSMEHRIKDAPKHKVDLMMTTVTGIPENLDQYLDYTMITQAEGLKFGIEHFRRRTPHCSGSLIWQLNDCWPGVSWSIVDYYGFGKAGYYYVRRAYAPVIASFKALENGDVELWVTNDTLSPIDDKAMIELGDFAKGTQWQETCGYKIGAQESRCIWTAKAERIAAQADCFLRIVSCGEMFPANRYFFAPIKDLVRPAPAAPAVKFTQIDPHELSVEISAADYLYFVHFLTADEKTHFSDNYFDLTLGESRTIHIRNVAREIKPDDVVPVWR